MNAGVFLDKLLWSGVGVYAIYLSLAKKEKVGGKAALPRFLGIGLVLFAVITTLVQLFSK